MLGSKKYKNHTDLLLSMRLKNILGLKIYDDTGKYIGTVKDVMISVETGEIKYLLKERPMLLLRKNKKEAVEFIRQHFIPFSRVKSIKEIVLIKGDSR